MQTDFPKIAVQEYSVALKRRFVALRTIFLALLLGVGCTSLASNDSWASRGFIQFIQFSPAACADNPGGRIFVAVGTRVLRLPPDYVSGYIGFAPNYDELLPRAPDPDEPHGCPGNPLRGNVAFRAPLDALITERTLVAEDNGKYVLFQLIQADSYVDSSAATHFQSRCHLFGVIDRRPNGLVGCGSESYGTGYQEPYSRIVTYKADNATHTTPYGGPFYVQCDEEAGRPEPACSIRYQLLDNMAIFIDFYEGVIEIDDIVDIDISLRELIEKSIQEDFRWPVQ